jgi:hypothetical protein
MSLDPIVALESIGYTRREASFLYLVAVHSGYFLRRQFDYFTDRQRGGLVLRFLEKARVNGHIQFFDARHGRQVYHLFHKPIYRLLGNPESQNRRVKADTDVRARLMKLDYVLENSTEHFLASDEEKIEFFSRIRNIDAMIFTASDGALRQELQSMPVSLVDRTAPSSTLVRFAFIDEALLTTAKFRRVLSSLTPLLSRLGSFELVYVSTSEHNFEEAATIFWHQFPRTTQPEQPALNRDWREGQSNPVPRASALRPQFVTVLLGFHYPSLQKNEIATQERCSR